LVTCADPGCSDFRHASIVDDGLQCMPLSGALGDALPASEAVAAALDAVMSPAVRLGLLAGRVGTDAAAREERARCLCFAVGHRALCHAIVDGRLISLAEIGAVLGAGSNCGSCVPELQQILRDAQRGGVPAA
jgi:assimilatory nitrate reductase catalytic subunit